MNKVAIILLNWNGATDTIECLESLKNVNYLDYDIYLVDNNSRKESIDELTSYIQNDGFYSSETIAVNQLDTYRKNLNTNLLFILNDNNAGFAGGNNVALRYIMNNNLSEYVMLLNNDTVVSSDFINGLIDKVKQSDENGFVGINTYYYDNNKQIQTVGGGLVDLVHGECSAITSSGIDEFDFITGSCVLMPLHVLKEVGLMDESYFMYWEDVDWSTRTRNKGYKLRVADYGYIYHKEGASIHSMRRIYYHTRNRIKYMKKFTKGFKLLKFIIYIILFVIKESLTNIIKNREYSKALLNGLIKGL